MLSKSIFLDQPFQIKLDSVDLVEVSSRTAIWPCSTGINFFRLVELDKSFLVLSRLNRFKGLLHID